MVQVSAQSPESPCLSLGMPAEMASAEGLQALRRIARQHDPVSAGTRLYEAGDPLGAIYAVRSGAVKTVHRDASGEEQVVAFHLPGEFFGLSGIAEGHYPGAAITLTRTAVCALPYQRLFRVARESAVLRRQLLRLLSGVIVMEQGQYAALAGHTAEVRLAFVLDRLRQRLRYPATPGTELRLPMTRAELGSSIGLAAETTSRVFHRLQARGLIEASGRRIRYVDPPALARLGAPADAAESAAAGRLRGYSPAADSVRSCAERI